MYGYLYRRTDNKRRCPENCKLSDRRSADICNRYVIQDISDYLGCKGYTVESRLDSAKSVFRVPRWLAFLCFTFSKFGLYFREDIDPLTVANHVLLQYRTSNGNNMLLALIYLDLVYEPSNFLFCYGWSKSLSD